MMPMQRLNVVRWAIADVASWLAVALVISIGLSCSCAVAKSRLAQSHFVPEPKQRPANLVLWELSDQRRLLVREIADHNRRDTLETQSVSAAAPIQSRIGSRSLRPVASHTSDDPLSFGHLWSPLGSFWLVSPERGPSGNIKGVDFLAFDNPNSKWNMHVKVHRGAIFQISRRWGETAGPGPFSKSGKASLLPPH